jgi:hypothetical protein
VGLRADGELRQDARVNPDGFLADVLAEPAGLDAVLDAATAVDSPLPALAAELEGRRVVLTGMGSSRFAALPAAALLRRRGVHAVAELSSTDLPVPPGEDVVAIGISASGGSEETVEALERHRGRSRTVAITNHPEGPLADVADVVVALHTRARRPAASPAARSRPRSRSCICSRAPIPRSCAARPQPRPRCSTRAASGSRSCSRA